MQTKEIVLQKIANTLYINFQMMQSRGLLDGQLGAALLMYHYARFSGYTHYRIIADEYIDDIFDSLSLDTPPNFASGLAGIGWTLQYLIDNGFIEGDADEVLENIDSVIRNMDISADLDEEIPLMSQGLYFLKRGKKEIVEEIVRKLEPFLSEAGKLPVVYLDSVSYILSEARRIGIKSDLQINLPERKPEIESTWTNLIYSRDNFSQTSVEEINDWIEDRMDNLREQDLMLYIGITGVGLELMK